MWIHLALSLGLLVPGSQQDVLPGVPANRPVYVQLDGAERVHGRLTAIAPDSLAPERRRGVLHVLASLIRSADTRLATRAELDAWFAERDAQVEVEADGDRITFVYECGPQEHVAVFERIVRWARGARVEDEAARAALARYAAELSALEQDRARFDETPLVENALGAASWPAPRSGVLTAMLPTAIGESHRAMWGRNSTFCTAAGPGDGAAWLAAAKEFLDAQPKDAPARARPPRRPAPEHPVVVDVPERTTSEVRVAWDVYPGDEEYAALWLWTEIATREEDTNPDFRWASVPPLLPRSETAAPLYLFGVVEPDAVLSELKKLRGFLEGARAMEEPQWELSRRALVRELRDAEGSAEERLRRAEESLRDRAPAALWPQRLKALEALEYAAYQSATERALAAPLRWVSVGPAQALRSWPPEVEVRAGRAETATTPEGAELAERMLAALGGRERWSELTGFRSVRKVLIAELEEPVDVHVWADFEGDRLCMEQNLPGSPLLYILHEDGGWRRAANNVSELSASVHGTLRQRQERTLFRVLRSLARGEALTLRSPEERRLEIYGPEGLWCWLTLDADGRPDRLGYQIPGERLETQYLFREWDEVQGYTFARHVHQLERGTETKTLTQEFNPTFDPELFERP